MPQIKVKKKSESKPIHHECKTACVLQAGQNLENTITNWITEHKQTKQVEERHARKFWGLN